MPIIIETMPKVNTGLILVVRAKSQNNNLDSASILKLSKKNANIGITSKPISHSNFIPPILLTFRIYKTTSDACLKVAAP